MLYAAIYSALSEKQSEDEDIKNELYNLKHRLLQKAKKEEPRLQLSEQKNNNEDYKAILKELNLLRDVSSTVANIGNRRNVSSKAVNIGNRRIYKAYQYFKKRLERLKDSDLLGILDRTNSALLVKIEVNSHSDAFLLFEGLNNRGLPLSAVDLIKNNVLSVLEKKNIKPIDEAFADWCCFIDNLSDYTVQERFLRQYYNAFKYKESVGIPNISKATRSNLIRIYDTLISRDPSGIFEGLVRKAAIYNQFIDPESCPCEAEIGKGLRDLQNVGAAPSYAFLLYLFSEHYKAIPLPGVVTLLVKYFIRRNITDYPATRDLDTIFMDLIETCEKGPISLDLITTFLTDPKRFSQLGHFAERLQGNIYEENTDAARFILTQIEESRATRENAKDLWARGQNGRLVWSIEHIFPEGEKIPAEWKLMIADGDSNMAESLRAEYTHRIGNLTLSAYNSKLFNYPFEKKRDLKDNKEEYIGYKNGLYLNQYLKDKLQWTIEDIMHRTNELTAEAISIFKLQTEKI